MKILLAAVLALLVVAGFCQARQQTEEDLAAKEDEFWFKKAMVERLVQLHRPEGSDQEMTQIYLREVEELLDMEMPDDPELRKEILDNVAKEIGFDKGHGDSNPHDRFQEEAVPA